MIFVIGKSSIVIREMDRCGIYDNSTKTDLMLLTTMKKILEFHFTQFKVS